MTVKTLSAIAILSAALSSPVLAQSGHMRGPAHNGPAYHLRHFRGVYNQAPLDEPYYTGAPDAGNWIGEDRQFDRSFPGGHNPDLNPPGT
jgi:hypothetical protein